MSIEQALIAQTTPKIFTAKLRDFIRSEITKGCQSEISPFPVSLEPNFTPLWTIRNNPITRNQPQWTEREPIFYNDLIRLRVWISPEQNFDWNNCELFLKQLLKMSYRTCFEIFGNNEGITISFLIHHLDRPILTAAFEGDFDFCELTPMTEGRLSDLPKTMWKDIAFQDYFPSPPYSHFLNACC